MLNWIQRKTVRPPPGESEARASNARVETAELLLLQGVRQGQQRAFEALYRLYHPRLLRFLRHMIRQAEQELEEVLNDTMMVVWKRADTFDGRSRLSTWIFGIAYRKALKALSRLDLPLENADLSDTPDPSPGPEAHTSVVQLRARLERAMSELSMDHRAVVELCYFQDMSHGEIAEVVGCPAETVKTRMFYARRRLRALLEDMAGDMPGDLS